MRSQTLEQESAQDFAGLQNDLLQKLRKGAMSYAQLKWFVALSYDKREALKDGSPVAPKAQGAILRLLSEDENLKLDAVDGKQTIADSKNTFGWIDGDFKGWRVNEKSGPTPETAIEVYEMIKDATFAKMFASMPGDLDKLCVTQHQILNFIAKHRNWLRTDGYATFFLFKMNGEFFVARVRFDDDGSLRVDVHRFERDYVWYGLVRHRVVVPETYCFSRYLTGVFFSNPFFHPPTIFPSSSSKPDSSVYFLSGMHLFSQQI